MTDLNGNPLKEIFKITKKGEISEEINSIDKINLFFKYLKNDKIPCELRSSIIEDFIKKIKSNRYLCEYFSTFENESIYFFLTKLYLNKSSTKKLKDSILNLISELRINLDINKKIYDYIFQKMSLIYRNVNNDTKNSKDLLHEYLILLESFLGETATNLKPRHYFCCSGDGGFEVDLSSLELNVGCSFTFILNFKLGNSKLASENPESYGKTTLVDINFSNGYNIDIDFVYPGSLVVKEIQDTMIKSLPVVDWMNLIINIVLDDKNNMVAYFYTNGENRLAAFPFKNPKITNKDTINSIKFFNNFYGEVSSITFLSQKDYGYPGVNASDFLLQFKQYEEGLWKKKKIDNFMNLLNEFDSIGVEKTKSRTVFKKTPMKIEKKVEKEDAFTSSSGKLLNNLIFIFTPLNYYNDGSNKNIIENVVGNLTMKFYGNVRPHKYYCFQKRIGTLGVINNMLPIAEMFVIYPDLLDEKNLDTYLNIIKNILYDKKHNCKYLAENYFFQILSLFLEKYPKNIFTEKILNTFADIGKCLLGGNVESTTSLYFEHILLNEKILIKYSEALQIKFWEHILLFCQMDSSQIEVFINMNRICLILRFYDRNKYSEICCERHKSVIKEEFLGNKVIMNPPMNQKLSKIQNILNVIISSQESEKAFALFKLLTLDLSPCLTEFILNIFINEFKKRKQDTSNWKDNFINVLIENKYETIIANTFLHSLPEIKISLLTLITEISFRLQKMNKISYFKSLEKIIRQLILPQDNFFWKSNHINNNNNDDNKIRNSAIFHPKVNNNKNTLSGPMKNIKSNEIKEDKPKNNTNINNNKMPEVKKINTIQGNKVSSMISKFENMKNIPGLTKPSTASQPQKEKDKNKGKEKEKEKEKIEPKNTPPAQKPPTEKNNLDELPDGEYKLNYENDKGEIIIVKNNLYFDYVEKVYKLLLLWSINLPPNSNFNQVDLKRVLIDTTTPLEFLLSISLDINHINFYFKCIKNFYLFSNIAQNAAKLLYNNKIISLLLEIEYKYYKAKEKQENKCFELIKTTLMNIFMNSMAYAEQNQSIYPCDKIDILFLWGDKTIFNMKTKNKKDEVLDFLNEFIFEFLTSYKIKYERLMDLIVNKPNFNSNPCNNFYLKNYFILMTHLFRFSFFYKHDEIIKTEGLTFIAPSPLIINLLYIYKTGMRLNPLKGEKMIEQWIDYPFFDDLYRKISLIWSKIKNYTEKKKGSGKQNKTIKYEKILNKVILNKDQKNIYQKELELLCFEEIVGEKELVMSLIKIIPIQLMCVIKSSETEANFLYWLKELKKFIRFIIIASSNLIRTNQMELYLKLQEKCWLTLVPCLCFLKELQETSNMCKEKIQSTIYSIMLFCCIIVKYQYDYILKHKGIKKIKIIGKPSRNDLVQCAIFVLFTDIIKDKTGTPLLNEKAINSLSINQYYGILGALDNNDWKEALFENVHLRERLYIDFFGINNYKKLVDNRVKQIKFISDEKDDEYKNGILELLPLYEKELLKYSNNSLEKNKKIKNIYKKFKKRSFSWNGFWSDRNLFFENTENLKFKVMNHLTKTLMKPVLEPILDIAYYLPAFSGFNTATLFNPIKNDKNTKFKLIMDIDKILKSYEQSNIKEIKNKLEEKNDENFLRNIYVKSNPDLAQSFQKIANSLDLGKEEEFTIIQESKSKNNKKEKKYFLSCLVKTSHHIKGVCFIDNNYLNFKVFLNQKTGSAMSGVEIGFTSNDEDYDFERHTSFGSYFMFHPKDKDVYKISINYNQIKWIFRRRYYYKNSALEIFTTTNKTFYFNFKFEDEREIVINEILKKLPDAIKIIDDLKDSKDIFENIIGFENISVTSNSKKKVKNIKISQKIELWKEWKMTNYEFLMWMNIYGNRSFNDISQYPVFPWILNDYKDPLKNEQNDDQQHKYNLRDMTLPMGMLTINDQAEARKEMFIENYETLKETAEDGLMKPYYFGTNYSNPIYVCHFLMRIFPFTQIAIELQGSKFDHAERLFLSVDNSFYYSLTQKTDVRELIPEFFYLPEIFLNINDLNMGSTEDGQKVNDILVPCHNNPYEFVQIMRTILESDEISNTIQNWIDLIFGSKSKGKEAENAKNLFTEESYQEILDITKVESKESTLRKVEFGLIPSQVMSKDCGKREKKDDLLKGKELTDSKAVLTNYECKQIKEQAIFNKYKIEINVLFGVEIAQDKICLVLSNNYMIEKKINFSSFGKEFTDDIINTTPMMNMTNKIVDYYINNGQCNKAIIYLRKLKLLVLGGFYDGKINIYSLEDKSSVNELIPFEIEYPIISISAGSDEEYLFVGNSIGNIVVYKISPDINKWKIIKRVSDQKSAISHIYCNSDLNLWLSTSIDGYINLYTLPLCKLARTIKVSTKKCSCSFLSSSPLPSIVIINDESNNSEIFVYSLNGKFITKQQLYYQLINPIIIKDLNSNEYLAYVGKDAISILSLPTLELVANIDINPDMGIFNIFTSQDRISLYCVNKIGSKVYVIRDEIKKVHDHLIRSQTTVNK